MCDSGIVEDCERSFLGDGKSDGWLARFSAYSYRVPISSFLPTVTINISRPSTFNRRIQATAPDAVTGIGTCNLYVPQDCIIARAARMHAAPPLGGLLAAILLSATRWTTL